MTNLGRPSLDILVPLIMIDSDTSDENDENMCTDAQKDILRHFESGDLVLICVESRCVPAIIFNASGLVMKLDIDRQLYHVCLFDRQLTEKWVDSNDMFIYSVPMIVECDDEEILSMWSMANEFLSMPNNHENRARLEEFQERYEKLKAEIEKPTTIPTMPSSPDEPTPDEPTPVEPENTYSSDLTVCEELAIVESLHRILPSSFNQAKAIAEETCRMIIYTNHREYVPLSQIKIQSEHWFITFLNRYIDQLRCYSNAWLGDLQEMSNRVENNESS